MKYDLLYLKNRTLALDLKIMLYTILIVVKGKGK
jgi:lipopolysaccharide/colanic/teichoic acid biosynthesis glycosyltransferase